MNFILVVTFRNANSPGLRCGGLGFKFGWGPGPLDRRVVGWSCLCLGYKEGVCFRYPTEIHWFMNRHVIRYDLSMILQCSKNWKMKDGEMDLIAQLLLKSRIGAYLEWLANELIMTANKIHT